MVVLLGADLELVLDLVHRLLVLEGLILLVLQLLEGIAVSVVIELLVFALDGDLADDLDDFEELFRGVDDVCFDLLELGGEFLEEILYDGFVLFTGLDTFGVTFGHGAVWVRSST